MNPHDYQLDGTVLKANDATTLWKTENGIVEISKNTLAVPIKQDDKTKGFVLHGKCRLVLDTIVETNRGAVGKPVEREITEPFLMFKDEEEAQQSFGTANDDDLKSMSYENQKGFITKAQGLYDEFLRGRSMHHHGHWHQDERWHHGHEGNGVIFVFPRKTERFDMLIANGSKLIYAAEDKTFISNGRKVILKTPEETVITRQGRSLVLKTRCGC